MYLPLKIWVVWAGKSKKRTVTIKEKTNNYGNDYVTEFAGLTPLQQPGSCELPPPLCGTLLCEGKPFTKRV